MWIMTRFGFFSIVQKQGERDLTIRSRVRTDLEELRAQYLPAMGEIREHEGTDYQYRANVSHGDFAEALRHIAMDIDYSNFKNTVAAEQGAGRAHVYGQVWSNLWKLNDK